MPAKILFTTNPKYKNPFRERIEEILSYEGEWVIISSGFFTPGGLGTDLFKMIEDGFNKTTTTNKRITIVYGSFWSRCKNCTHTSGKYDITTKCTACMCTKDPCNYCEAITVMNNLQTHFIGKHVHVELINSHNSLALKWHAKVALKIDLSKTGSNKTVAGIVGSSNMTKTALKTTVNDFSNIECDIYLSDRRYSQTKSTPTGVGQGVEDGILGTEITIQIDGGVNKLLEKLTSELLTRIYGKTIETVIKSMPVDPVKGIINYSSLKDDLIEVGFFRIPTNIPNEDLFNQLFKVDTIVRASNPKIYIDENGKIKFEGSWDILLETDDQCKKWDDVKLVTPETKNHYFKNKSFIIQKYYSLEIQQTFHNNQLVNNIGAVTKVKKE